MLRNFVGAIYEPESIFHSSEIFGLDGVVDTWLLISLTYTTETPRLNPTNELMHTARETKRRLECKALLLSVDAAQVRTFSAYSPMAVAN